MTRTPEELRLESLRQSNLASELYRTDPRKAQEHRRRALALAEELAAISMMEITAADLPEPPDYSLPDGGIPIPDDLM